MSEEQKLPNNENWKVIDGFPIYEINTMGDVRYIEEIFNSLTKRNRKRYLTQYTNADGYLFVVLCINGKRYNRLLHRLIASAFIH